MIGRAVHRVVDAPRVYRLGQRLLTPGAQRRLAARLGGCLAGRPAAGPALDVGCGPESLLGRVGLAPVGVDVAADRAAEFRRQAGGPAVVADATALPFAAAACAVVWSGGLLHHLPDPAARQAVRELARVTRPGGLCIVFDGVFPQRRWRHPVAWAIRRLDRGAWMRNQRALEALLAPLGSWRMTRLTYAATGLEGLWSVLARPGAAAAT
jgi:SAM-dependent methyltransferase